MTSPVVTIKDMPKQYQDRVPKTHLALLEEAGCEFDRSGPRFIRNSVVVIDFARATDCTLDELRAAISRAGIVR